MEGGVRQTPPFLIRKKKIMNDLLAQYIVGLVTDENDQFYFVQKGGDMGKAPPAPNAGAGGVQKRKVKLLPR